MNHNEAEDFLMHFGKSGMKWGHRSANIPTSGKTIAGQVAPGGMYLGNKSRFKTPEAQRLRRSAGRARAVPLAAFGANVGVLTLSMISKDPATTQGLRAVSQMLKVGTDAAAVTAAVQGVRATVANNKK